MKAHQTRIHWQALGDGIEARKRNRSEVRAYAKKRGIQPARQQAPAPKRTHRKVTPDQRNGGCRSLSAAEIEALGYVSAKPIDATPEPPKADAPKPKEQRSIEHWQRTRRLKGDWV